MVESNERGEEDTARAYRINVTKLVRASAVLTPLIIAFSH
jgi:hypothetical protein